MTDNKAAYLVATKTPLEIKSAPRPVPNDNEVVIKTQAVALNPVDWASPLPPLAVAAGYEVISTSSPKKFDYVKRLGACQVFDYNSTTLKEDLVTAFQNKTCAGAIVNGGLGMGDGSGPPMVEACAAVVSSSGLAHGNGMVAAAMVPSWNPSFAGVEVKFVEQLRGYTELASAVFHGYLSAALAQGSFVPLPEPEVGGHGLEAVQGAMDILKKGVSRTKIVVRM